MPRVKSAVASTQLGRFVRSSDAGSRDLEQEPGSRPPSNRINHIRQAVAMCGGLSELQVTRPNPCCGGVKVSHRKVPYSTCWVLCLTSLRAVAKPRTTL